MYVYIYIYIYINIGGVRTPCVRASSPPRPGTRGTPPQHLIVKLMVYDRCLKYLKDLKEEGRVENVEEVFPSHSNTV